MVDPDRVQAPQVSASRRSAAARRVGTRIAEMPGRRAGGNGRCVTELIAVLRAGVHAGLTPGAVAAISVRGQVRETVAVGLADRPASVAMTARTLFDIASLTKVVGTTTALMVLTGWGELDPEDRLDRFLSWPDPAITLAHLLTHRAGLLPWQPLYFRARNAAETVDVIRRLPPAGPVGSVRSYSDLGVILLGAVIEQVTGTDLASAVSALVTTPLKLAHTGFRPPGTRVPEVPVAATSPGDVVEQRMVATGEPHPVILAGEHFVEWRHHLLRGEVADGNAFHALGGVGGHAGLFSTADDLLAFTDGLLGHADFPAPREVVERYLRPGPDDQALGWWTKDLPAGIGIWHSGFTGTRLLVQPASGTAVVLLTNRLHVLDAEDSTTDGKSGAAPDIAPLWADVQRAAGLL